ncbi:Hypothetical protein (Fragment) [Durusdinium trenchii]|uniref:Uncharacterized protein n=1 Tax=Durusdinium trenchii TaxID=1381693 RepID=A0ABP0RMM4_9DINO
MADQSLLIETLQAVHQHTEGVLDLLMKACNKMSLSELSTECVHQSAALKDTKKLFQTLRDAAKSSAPDQVLAEMKSYAKQQAIAESQSLETRLQSTSARTEAAPTSDIGAKANGLLCQALTPGRSQGEAEESGDTGSGTRQWEAQSAQLKLPDGGRKQFLVACSLACTLGKTDRPLFQLATAGHSWPQLAVGPGVDPWCGDLSSEGRAVERWGCDPADARRSDPVPK